jgi:SAM-dependent methyltransferase
MIERCPFCTAAPAGAVTAREMMLGLRERFAYCRCGECGSLWLADPPEDLGRFYPAGYYSLVADPKGAEAIPLARLWTRALLRLPRGVTTSLAGTRGFPRYAAWLAGLGATPGWRVADLGAGEGALVYQLGRHGFADVWGLDPYLSADRDLGAVHLRRGDLSRADGPFDLVMFNHALEHTRDPFAELRSAGERLSPRGAIVVRIPVAGSLADRRYGADWVALDAPRHLAIPSRDGVARVAARAGLAVTRTFFDSTALQFWASEQYARDIPLHDPRSGPDAASLARLARRARAVNRSAQGDTAGYVLRPVAAGGPSG